MADSQVAFNGNCHRHVDGSSEPIVVEERHNVLHYGRCLNPEQVTSNAHHIAPNKSKVGTGKGKEKLVEDSLPERASPENKEREESNHKAKAANDEQGDQIWSFTHIAMPIPACRNVKKALFKQATSMLRNERKGLL